MTRLYYHTSKILSASQIFPDTSRLFDENINVFVLVAVNYAVLCTHTAFYAYFLKSFHLVVHLR